jgi:hypothetical protein
MHVHIFLCGSLLVVLAANIHAPAFAQVPASHLSDNGEKSKIVEAVRFMFLSVYDPYRPILHVHVSTTNLDGIKDDENYIEPSGSIHYSRRTLLSKPGEIYQRSFDEDGADYLVFLSFEAMDDQVIVRTQHGRMFEGSVHFADDFTWKAVKSAGRWTVTCLDTTTVLALSCLE